MTATSRPVPERSADDVARVQARVVRTLVLAQAIGATGFTIGIATASLLARDLSGSETLAGMAQTFQVLGAAVAAYVLGRLMHSRGRRFGISTGLGLGATGGLVMVVAGVVGSMPLLLVGAVLLGSTTAANNAARYAATDLAVAEHRGRSLAIVVWATTIGAVVGPNLTGPAGWVARRLDIPELTGPFAVGAFTMSVAAVVIFVLLRPDPLQLARSLAEDTGPPPVGRSWGRALAAVRERPVLSYAVLGLAGAHAAMVAVMVMTPLHMEHGGAELRIIGVVISVHVLGMFAFSPVVGWLADRWGRAVVLGLGGGILLLALVLSAAAPEGSSWQIFGGLFLLGLGWSFATIASSTIIADETPIEVRTDVQGSADMVMNLAAAAAGALSGLVVDLADYPTLALVAITLALAVVLAGVRARALAAHPL